MARVGIKSKGRIIKLGRLSVKRLTYGWVAYNKPAEAIRPHRAASQIAERQRALAERFHGSRCPYPKDLSGDLRWEGGRTANKAESKVKEGSLPAPEWIAADREFWKH